MTESLIDFGILIAACLVMCCIGDWLFEKSQKRARSKRRPPL